MVKIQLETGYLDVKDGTVFPLNIGVADIRDVSQRAGTFSKTITLVGSKNNHDLLNHYYDVNVVAGTFDINALTLCSVIQNGLVIVEDAYLQLISVNKLQQTGSLEEFIEYEVLVKDSKVDFFTKIDNAELTDLDFTDLNHTYSAANVVASFTNTVTDGYVYPLGGSLDNWYPLTECKPAIYAKLYWDRIHSDAGFSYTWSTLSDAKFDKCIIPYNGDKLNFDYNDHLVEATLVDTLSGTQPTGYNESFLEPLTGFTEVTDEQNLFDPTLGEYDVPFYVTAGQNIQFTIDVTYSIKLVNSTGANAYLVNMSNPFQATYDYRPSFQLVKNGSSLISVGIQFPEYYLIQGAILPSGTTTLTTQIVSAVLPATNLAPADIISIVGGVNVTANGAQLRWRSVNSIFGGTDVDIDVQLDITSLTLKVIPSSNIIGSGMTIEVNDFVPKKIKQKDFIKSICTMYNLYVTTDPDNTNKLIYQHRDDYYDAGVEKDWTQKIAKDREQSLQFLPELTAKKLILTYKQDKDEPNVVYEDTVKEIYGQVEFTFDNEYARGVDMKEVIFSPTPIGTTAFGAIVPLIASGNPATNIRILMHHGSTTCNPYSIYDYEQTGQTGLTSIPVISHFDDHINPTFDINFAPCDYYYYDNINLTNNTLYNLYWRRTIGQINTGKMLIAWFNLREDDIQDLQLNDKIRINNSWWHINRVVDYDANTHTLTKVELMSIDEGIDFAPFITLPSPPLNPNPVGPIKPVKPTKPLTPVGQIIEKIIANNNVNLSSGSVVLSGIGNVVAPGLSGRMDGNFRTMEESGDYPDLQDKIKYIGQDYIATNYDRVLLVDGTVTITLPSIKTENYKEITIKNIGSGTVTIEGDVVTNKIDGNTTIGLISLDSAHLISYNQNWLII